jgi:hypothetical protein
MSCKSPMLRARRSIRVTSTKMRIRNEHSSNRALLSFIRQIIASNTRTGLADATRFVT